MDNSRKIVTVAFGGPKAAEAPKASKTFVVRIPHPQEAAIVALLEDVATGGEDVAKKLAEALSLLTGDGVFASFSTHRVDRNGPTDEPLRDKNGLVCLFGNQVMAYGSREAHEGAGGSNDPRLLMKGWGGDNAGFTGTYMEKVNSAYRASIGLDVDKTKAAKALEQIPGGHQAAPATQPGQQVRLS